MTIREANVHDIPALIGMGDQFFQETAYSEITNYDPDSVESMLNNIIGTDNGVVLVAEDGHELTGMAGALLFPLYMNQNTIIAQELFWWVRPDKRGVGHHILREMESQTNNRGAVALIMMTLESVSPEIGEKIYTRRGYKKNENHFIKVF